jgi:peptidoglycan/xylan/chitin deacetylase (PgdA/CDA1 family)
MTTNSLWFPPADPNARTQGLLTNWSARGGRGAGESGETRVWTIEQEAAAQNAAASPRRGVNRRRVLFAAGGIMLLAGGGVATAAASGKVRQIVQAGGGGGKPGSQPLVGGPSSAAAHSGSVPASASASASAPASASGSASAPSGTASASASASESAGSSSSAPGNGQVATQPQWYVDDKGPMAIALTMDDGPNPTYTPQVLEIFVQYGIKATFNMIGEQVASNLSLVREVSAAGHTITNHTWDHADLSQCSYTEILDEIDRCNDALANAHQTPTILRAPYGNWSKDVFEACAARNLKPVGWSVDPRDWDTAQVDTQEIVANVMQNTRAHDIILEHDGGGVRRNTVAALKIFIPQLLAEGFNFVAM